jgi:chemotaxis protein methyltransferase CheR
VSDVLATLEGLVRDETGNELAPGRLPFLREAAERRAQAVGVGGLEAYVTALAAGELRGEWELLASFLTIKESSFFRVPQQWERIRGGLLPELVQRRSTSRKLRVWSAACAAGEEPATMALLLAEALSVSGWDWSIVATDLDPEALAQAERGLYGERALAAVPKDLLERWFEPRGRLWELDRRLRSRIHYQRMNLARWPYRLSEERFDLILLRNVLIYFRAELQRRVVDEVARRLAPDGWLFLGGSETLWRIQDRLVPVDLGDCFCYRLPDERAATAGRRAEARSAKAAPAAPARPAPRPAVDHQPEPAPPAAPAAPSPVERLVAAAGHLESDRFDDAERETAAALEEDPAEPAAHVVSGLIRDYQGRPAEAADAFRAALYLEPDLAQVRLLLAGCLRRDGHLELAERQYREVISTLERGGGRRLALLDGRLLPDPGEVLRRARDGLAALRGG